MATPRTTPAPTDRQVRRLFLRGASDEGIGLKLGLHARTVRAHRARLGLLRRAPGCSPIDEGRLVELHGAGLPTRELAQQLGCTYRSAQQFLFCLGLRANRQGR